MIIAVFFKSVDTKYAHGGCAAEGAVAAKSAEEILCSVGRHGDGPWREDVLRFIFFNR